MDLNFRGDYRRKALILKKLVRLKYQVDDNLKDSVEKIIQMIEESM